MKKALSALALAVLVVPALAGAKSSPPLTELGMGRVGAAETSCAGISQGCLSVTGTFKGRPIVAGSFTAKFTVDWSSAKKLANGATCATGGGSVELTGKNGDALTLSETGHVCRGGSSSYPYRFNGTYSVDQGAGKYASEGVGTGKASWQFLPARRVRIFAVGGFKLLTRPPV